VHLDSRDACGAKSHLEHHAARRIVLEDLRRVVQFGRGGPDRMMEP
jgi:hypothetical protein